MADENEREQARQFTEDMDRLIGTLEKASAAGFALVDSIQTVADHLFEIAVEVRGVRESAVRETIDRVVARQSIKRALDKARGLRG